MKKTLLALALVAGFAGVAQAQSTTNVTLYGLIDEGLVYSDPETGDATTGLNSGIQSGSRWGLKGSEDLGNGLKVNFQLESGFGADDGKSLQGGRLFGRWSWLGLSGGFGEVRLGRQWAAGYELGGLADPFGTGFGSAGMQSTFTIANAVRVDNAVVYRSPVINGFLGVIGYSFNAVQQEVAGFGNNPSAVTVGAGYLNGPLAILGTYEQVKTTALGAAENQKDWWLSASYDFQFVKPVVIYGQGKHENAAVAPLNFGASDDSRSWLVGATVPLGGGSVLASYQSRDDKAATDLDGAVASVGYTYPLSKRTNVYTYFANVNGKHGNDGTDKNEFAVGLRHTF